MADELRAALVAIATHEPYPEDVWTPLTEAEEEMIRLAIRDSGVRLALDRSYAQWGRYVGEGFRRLAADALDQHERS